MTDSSIVDNNSEEGIIVSAETTDLGQTGNDLVSKLGSGKNNKYKRFVLAVLGSIPWVGSVLSASAGLSAEVDQDKINDLQRLWVEEHEGKINELASTVQQILERFNNFGVEVQKRIESPEYLSLVRKTFRSWDQAETQEKKEMLKKLITNAGAITLCPDDLVRLFISWIDQYHEAHFLVVKEIYQNSGITRGEIWNKIHGERPREDSPEADLFRYLIRDLSTGGVVRQQRDVTSSGEFLRQRRAPKGSLGNTMESAFDETKHYVLTGLGEQFVHYVMTDLTVRLTG